MLDPLDSAQLLAFVAVARERGFSRAARRLGRTQSAVSQAVARLEADLDSELFARRGRTVELTAAGRTLLSRAERVLDEMSRARASLRGGAAGGEGAGGDDEALLEGWLTVGTSDTLAYYALPPLIAAFRARYPRVDLRLDNRPSPVTAERVAERAVDVGVVTLPLPSDLRVAGRPLLERVTVEPLCPQPEVAICPPGHPLAARRRVTLSALARHPLLLLDRSTSARALLDADFARLGLSPTVAMEMSSVEVQKRLVELGLGVSIVPALAVEREVKAGVLAAVPLAGLSFTRRIGLLLPAGHPHPAATTAFARLSRLTLAPPGQPRSRTSQSAAR